MSKTHRATRALALCAFAALLLAPLPASTINGDDVFLLTTSVAPNVILLFDNSDSMAQIEWHPAFDQSVVPTGCADFADATQYDAGPDLANQETHCGNTRNLYDPTDAKTPTVLWWGRYLNWYFSDAADAYATEIETAEVADLGCNKTSEYPDKFRRTRGQAAKETMLTVLCIAEPLDVRFGLANFRDREDGPPEDANGGYVGVELDRSNPSHASELESHIKNTVMGTDSPLAEALFQVYTYFMPRVLTDMPKGADGILSFPRYQYAKDGDWEALSTKWTADPMEYPCQKTYVVVVTDGTPDRDDFDLELTLDEATGFASFPSLIGDYHDEGGDGVADAELPGNPEETSWYLDDIAKYMQDNDFRPDADFPDDQVIDVYTVGFASDATTNSFLQMTADVGNGIFFEAKDGEALALALLAALNDIIEKSRSFTAATVPSARTADGGAFFNSFFLPSGSSAFWQGHLRAWTIDAAGDILDANGDCAVLDPDPGECNSGVFKPICVAGPAPDCAVPFWDAGEEIPAQASRELKVSLRVSGTPTLLDFDDSLLAADLTIATFATPPAPAPNSALYPVHGSSALNAEGLADEVVYYARGCHFGTGVSSADVATPTACVERPWLLGDIFHSNPIVITHPRQFILEPSYRAFGQAYEDRSRVILAGTNAGWLEAFHAGDYDTDTDKYDAGSGTERFGFMPWQLRKTIKQQPIDFPTSRTHYVDGALQAADVWIHPTPTTSAKAANGAEWRTILVGGLRGGGSQYFALDLTNPDGITGPHGSVLPYPGYQWEFPDENDSGGDLARMGETWGTPVITKVRLEVVDDKGPGNRGYERWVAIVTAGYHPESDPNPTEVTGLASASYVDDASEGRAIYMLDIKTGEVLAQKTFTGNSSDCPNADDVDSEKNMCFAFVASPSVLDLNFDGFADVVYAVDMGGQVFKWVISALGEDRVNDGSGLRTQPSWPFRRFFKAPTASFGGDSYYKNLFFPPAASMIGGQLWLGFGSGERLHIGYPGDGDADDPDADDENNRFWVMTDLDPFESAGLAELDEGDLTDVTGNEAAATFSTRGYYFKVPDGEKFVTNVEIFVGDIIAASFTPATGSDVCTARGDAKLYAFNVRNGEGQFKDDSDDPTRGLAIGTGLPTDPKISIGVGGTDTRIIIEKSGADFESEAGKDVDVGGRLLYWRER